MKITFVLDTYAWLPVGGYRVVYEYANNLVRRGYDVSVVHPRLMRNITEPKEFKNKILRKIGGIRNLFFKPKHNWQFIDDRVKMLYVPEPISEHIPDSDVVFATAWSTAEYVMNYPEKRSIKFYLVQNYENWAPEDRLKITWKSSLHKIVIAKWLYKKGLELGVPEKEMDYIPNGIDLDKFKLINDIKMRSPQVAMLYSSLEWKGSKEGIGALKIVKNEFKDLKVVLFGTDKKPPSLPNWIKYYRNPPQKTLVEDIYNRSSIYLCSSWAEGWALPSTEAMACGCAVVSTDIAGVSEYAINEFTALLSEPRNPGKLAENILTLLRNNDLRIKLALNGNKKIKTFEWDKSIDKLEKVFMEYR